MRLGDGDDVGNELEVCAEDPVDEYWQDVLCAAQMVVWYGVAWCVVDEFGLDFNVCVV